MSIIHKGQIIASNFVTGDTLPIGSMIPYPSDTIPENWLLCDGRAVSRADYSELFEVMGTSHGAGNGSTTFNLPNIKGRTIVGKSSDTEFNALGKTGGNKTHTLTTDEMPKHYHRSTFWNGPTGSPVCMSYVSGSNIGYNLSWQEVSMSNITSNLNTDYRGGDQAHNNLQPYITENYIIKAKQSAGVVAKVVDSLESESAVDALSAKQGKLLNESLNNKTKKDIITVDVGVSSLSLSVGTSYAFNVVNVSRTIASLGDGLTRVSNGVKIGPGIKKVLVSGNVMINQDGDRSVIGQIGVNGGSISGGCQRSADGYSSVGISSRLVPVVENDIINLGYGSNRTGSVIIASGIWTWLTVEVVEYE